MCRYCWLCVGIVGFVSVLLAMCRYCWLCVGIVGYVSVLSAMCRYCWPCISIAGYVSVLLVIALYCQLDFTGYFLVLFNELVITVRVLVPFYKLYIHWQSWYLNILIFLVIREYHQILLSPSEYLPVSLLHMPRVFPMQGLCFVLKLFLQQTYGRETKWKKNRFVCPINPEETIKRVNQKTTTFNHPFNQSINHSFNQMKV